MPKLQIEDEIVEPNDSAWSNLKQANTPVEKVRTLNCGPTSFIFKQTGEIRFGPLLYKVAAEGEHSVNLNKFLANRIFLFFDNSFNKNRGLTTFEEVLDRHTGTATLHIFDLEKELKIKEIQGPQISFFCWRPNSTELIYWKSDGNFYQWHIIDVVHDRKPSLLSSGGDSAFLSADGRYFIILSTAYGYIRLFDLNERRILDEKKVEKSTHDVVLNVKSFDPSIPRVIVGLSDPKTGIFKKLNSISVSS